MSRAILFSMYLSELMQNRKFDVLVLAKEMGYRTLVYTSSWCRGDGLPHAYELPRLAEVLQTDVVSLAATWLIAKCPELEMVLRDEVLEPRGCYLPDLV